MAQERSATDAAAPRCTLTYADVTAFEDQIERADTDARTCAKRHMITARTEHKILSGISSLRDGADYDRRRAHGELSAPKERQFERRLAYLMQPLDN